MKDLNEAYRPNHHIRKKVNVGYHVTKWVVFIVFIFYGLSLLFPFLWMTVNSFKTNGDFSSGNYFLLPNPKYFSNIFDLFANYKKVLFTGINSDGSGENVLTMFFMSVVTTTLGTIINVGLSACIAYVVAKYKFIGRGFIYGVAIFSMVVPIVGTLPAQVKMMETLGLDNNLLGVLFLYSGCFGFNFILLYSAFSSISNTYMEAASVDCAGRFKTFFKVMLPMARGPIVAASVLTAIGYWNDYQTPYLYLPKDYQTLAVGLQKFQENHPSNYPIVFTSMLISVIPILIVYLVFQKTIIKSTNAGGLKG